MIGLHAEGGNAYSLEDDLQLVDDLQLEDDLRLEDDLQLEEGSVVSAKEGSYWASDQEERWGKSLGKGSRL